MPICPHCGDSHGPESHFCGATGQPLDLGPRLIGQILLDGYEVVNFLGEGPVGAVLEVEREEKGERKLYAAKMLHPRYARDDEAVARFLEEAEAAGKTGHPHVAAVFATGRDTGGAPLVIREYMEGESLDEVLEDEAPLPIIDAVRIARQILDGLAAAHGAGVANLDLSPGDVFLVHSDQGQLVPKLVDFGEAHLKHKLEEEAKSHSSPYFPPEFARGEEVDQRVDLWATACILHQMLTGELPFGEEPDWSSDTPKAPSPVRQQRKEVDRLLEAVLMKALSFDVERRYQDASAFEAALARATGDRPSLMPPPPGAAAKISFPPPPPETALQKAEAAEAKKQADEQAEKAAAEESAKRAEEAKKKADDAAKKAEADEAKKKAEEAKKKADDAAKKAETDEAKKKAEEAKKKADDAAKKAKADEAKKEAEEAKKKADEPAKAKTVKMFSPVESSEKADEKKADEKKADEKKADEKKADEKKADEKKADEKKADEKKADEKKADEKKADKKKAGATTVGATKKSGTTKKSDAKKAGEKKAGEKKAGEKKSGTTKKSDEKKADEKKKAAAVPSPSSASKRPVETPADDDFEAVIGKKPVWPYLAGVGALLLIGVIYFVATGSDDDADEERDEVASVSPGSSGSAEGDEENAGEGSSEESGAEASNQESSEEVEEVVETDASPSEETPGEGAADAGEQLGAESEQAVDAAVTEETEEAVAEATEEAEETEDAATEPELIQISLRATPAKTVLSLDGTALAGNPYQSEIERSNQLHIIRATAKGYRPQVRRVRFDQDREIVFELEEAPVAAVRSGSARPTKRPAGARPRPAKVRRPARPSSGGASSGGFQTDNPFD